MTLEDLEQMKDTLYSDFDNFWSYNVLKQELENKNTTYIVAKENDEIIGFAGLSTCLDEAISLLKIYEKQITFVGDGAITHQNLLQDNFKNCLLIDKNQLSSYSLGLAGLNTYKKGIQTSLMPLYLRKSQAERALEENTNKERFKWKSLQ